MVATVGTSPGRRMDGRSALRAERSALRAERPSIRRIRFGYRSKINYPSSRRAVGSQIHRMCTFNLESVRKWEDGHWSTTKCCKLSWHGSVWYASITLHRCVTQGTTGDRRCSPRITRFTEFNHLLVDPASYSPQTSSTAYPHARRKCRLPKFARSHPLLKDN